MIHSLTIKYYIPDFLENVVVYFLLLYRRKIYGFPFRRIKLNKNKPVGLKPAAARFAIVDPEDFKKINLFNWFAVNSLSTFYAVANNNGKRLKMHRLIMNTPDYLYVDHINHNGIDNRKANLRNVTPAQNSRNRFKGKKKTSSKYKGVYFMKGYNKWRVDIYLNSRPIFVGYFDTEEEAARAYDKKAKELFGEFASLNFP